MRLEPYEQSNIMIIINITKNSNSGTEKTFALYNLQNQSSYGSRRYALTTNGHINILPKRTNYPSTAIKFSRQKFVIRSGTAAITSCKKASTNNCRACSIARPRDCI